MIPLPHVPAFIPAAAVSALFAAIWEGTILAAAAAICMRMLPRMSAASRSAVWMSVFALVVLLQIAPALTGGAAAGSANGFGAHAIQIDVGWSLAIAAAWALLSAWRLVQLISSALGLQRLAARATLMPTDAALDGILRGDGRAGRTARLCVSGEVERPCVFGFFRPRILIPPAVAEKLSAQELHQVVLHEMEHLRRRDDWTNLVQKLALAVFPLNPVLLWVERRVCAERELACDDRVLRSSGARKAYALCLTHLAEYSMVRRSLSLVLGAWERQSELVRRVHRLLRGPDEPMGGRKAAMVTGGVICAVLSAAAVLARCPQPVGFVASPEFAAHGAVELGALQKEERANGQFLRSSVREAAPLQPQVRAEMVQAVMPVGNGLTPSAAHPMGTAHRPHGVAGTKAKPRQVQADEAWFVLTELSESAMPPRIVFAVAPGNRVTYEAVRVPNGWLIVQI